MIFDFYMIIVLDTNFLIYMIKHRIADQLKEFRAELVIPSTVKQELKKTTLGTKEKAFAGAALELIEIWRVKIIESKVKDVDQSIIEVAKILKKKKKDVYVATMDKALIDELLGYEIKNISVKRGKILSKD